MRRLVFLALDATTLVDRALMALVHLNDVIAIALQDRLDANTKPRGLHDLWISSLHQDLDEEARASCAE